CQTHGLVGHHFGCRHIALAVGAGGPDPGTEWWAFRLSTDDPSQSPFGAWICRECISRHRLPSSVALLDDPAFPQDVSPSTFMVPICPSCFDQWRTAHGDGITGGPEVL